MNNIQNRSGNVTEGKKQTAWTMQRNAIKVKKRFSLTGFLGGGEGKLRCDMKTEGGIRLLKCI